MTTLRDRVDSIAVIGTMQMGRGMRIVVESWSIETGATETRTNANGSHHERERVNQTNVIVTILR
jgi:hypothetical protein